MFAKTSIIAMVMGVLGILAATAGADTFMLFDDDHKDVTDSYDEGVLFDESSADVLEGGFIDDAEVNDASQLNVVAGEVDAPYAWDEGTIHITDEGKVTWLEARDDSTIETAGGECTDMFIRDNSTLKVTGGYVDRVTARGESYTTVTGGVFDDTFEIIDWANVDISGGLISELQARHETVVTLDGHSFEAAEGLELEEYDVVNGVTHYKVVGTGTLTGQWFDVAGTWTTEITWNDEGSKLLAIPEPATLGLLAAGGLVLLGRRRRR